MSRSSPAIAHLRSAIRHPPSAVLWGLALIGLGLLAGYTVWFCIRALAYPYQLLYGEGFMLEFARRLAAGEAVYKPVLEFPLGTANYPPLPLLLARMAFFLTGVGYAAGRIWAILAAFAVAGVLAIWVWRATRDTPAAIAAGLAWVGAPYVYHWAPQFRTDLPGLAFSLAGIYLVWRKWDSRAVYAAAPLFVLGLYCKQSFVAAPAAGVVALLLSGRPRRGLILAGLTLLLGGGPFLALNTATGGAFWTSLVTANVGPFDLGRLAGQLADFLRTYAPFAVLSLVGLIVPGSKTLPVLPAGRDRSLAIYVVLAVATAGMAGKAGSWENYFLEPLAALCLGGGLGLARMRGWRAGRWLAPALAILQAALMWHTPGPAAAMMRADAAASESLIATVSGASGLVLSEDAGLLIQAGRPVPYYDFQLSQLARVGRWDQSWEVSSLREGRFALVIFEDEPRIDVDRYGRYTRAFMSALDYGYRPAEQVGKYQVYRPAPLGRERPVQLERGLALVGHTLPAAEVQPGQTLSLDIVWQATQPVTGTYTSFLHLVDVEGQGRAGDDRQPWNGLYPTSRWAAGEMVRMTYTLTLPADLPPGRYMLTTGWYDGALRRLLTHAGADRVPVAMVVVPGEEKPPGSSAVSLDARFDGAIRLLGYDLLQKAGALAVELAWETDQPLAKDYTVFVHLRDATGRTVLQGDAPPQAGEWPTSLWPVGYRIQDVHRLPLVAGLPSGTYELVAGLYDPITSQRVQLAAGGNELSLGTITLP